LIFSFFARNPFGIDSPYVTKKDVEIGMNYIRLKYSMIRNMVFCMSEQVGKGKFMDFGTILKFMKQKFGITVSLAAYFTSGRDMSPTIRKTYENFLKSLKHSQFKTLALTSLREYNNLDFFSLRAQVGGNSHPIVEFYTNAFFRQSSLNIPVSHENKFITGVGTIPDNTIVRNHDFQTKIELTRSAVFKRILGRDNLEGISVINVDFTLSRAAKIILEKITKDYQAEDKLLLIVLIGKVTDSDYKNLKATVDDLKPNSGPGSQWFDNVEVISLAEYLDLFGIDQSFIAKCNKRLGLAPKESLDTLMSNVLNSIPPARDQYMQRLLEISERASYLLDNWNQRILNGFL
jgi:hypothetical protein